MRRALISIFCMSVFAVAATLMVRADDAVPKRPNFERYTAMLNRSPFAVASAVVAPAATPTIFKDLYIANAAHTPDGDSVTIGSTSDKDFKKYLTTKEPLDGYSIASIQWSEKVGETKVTICKDGECASLTFNQAIIVQPVSGRPPPPAPAVPQPPYKPAPIPGMPAPTPHVRGVIQRNPGAQTPQPVQTPPPQSDD